MPFAARKGLELLSDVVGMGSLVQRHRWYGIRLRLWLNKGDAIVWNRPWGTDPARLDEAGQVLVTHVRIDREMLIAGLFHGCQGMRVGGCRRLRIAPHLAYGKEGISGVIPANALLIAELHVESERYPA